MILRLLLATLLGVLLVGLSWRSARLGMAATVGWLLVMGGVRRWLIPLSGYQPNDPLVIVGAAVAGVLYLRTLQTAPPPSRLSKLMTGLLVLMCVQVLNPLQGGLSIGITACFFYLVPVLWFFIARRFGDGRLLRWMLVTYIGVAIPAALYSLYQTYFGFTVGEETWIASVNFIALNVGRIRPFSFLTSPSELAQLLSSSTVALVAAFICGQRRALIPVPLLAVALFLVSARGALVTGLGAICLVWAMHGASGKSWIPRIILAVVVVVGLSAWSLSHVTEESMRDERIRSLVQHQVEGLSDPFGEHSSGRGHVAMVLGGIWTGLKTPWGHGLGSTTGAAGKFGGSVLGTEADVSDMFVSLGLIGGILYICIIWQALRTAVIVWRCTRSPLVLMATGVLFQQLLGWLNSGQYATVMFDWVAIGTLDSLHGRLQHLAAARARGKIHTRPATYAPGALHA